MMYMSKKLTNSQKFVYTIYLKLNKDILTYLKLKDANREYQRNEHSLKHSYHTYANKDNQESILAELEAKLVSHRVSLRKLQKINRCIKKAQKGSKLPSDLDFLTEYFVDLFFKNTNKAVFKEVRPTNFQMQKISKFKSIKRHRAQKTLDTRVQARIINRRLTKLYYTLYPKGTDCFNFIKGIMLETAQNGDSMLQQLVAKAKEINPNYNYF